MLATFLGMSWWSWFLLAISTVIAAAIVKRSQWPNWTMIPVILAVWSLSYVVIWVLKLAILLLPLIIIGVVIYVMMFKKRKAGT